MDADYLKSSIKITAFGFCATIAYLYWHIPSGYFAIILGLVMYAPTAGGIKERLFSFGMGILFGFLCGLFLIKYTIHYPFLTFLLLSLWAISSLYITQYPSVGRFTGIMLAVLPFVMVNEAMADPNNGFVVGAGLGLFFLSGGLGMWFINRLLWPGYAFQQLGIGIGKVLRAQDNYLQQVIGDILSNTANESLWLSLNKGVQHELMSQQQLIKQAKYEASHITYLQQGSLRYYTQLEILQMSIFQLSNNVCKLESTLLNPWIPHLRAIKQTFHEVYQAFYLNFEGPEKNLDFGHIKKILKKSSNDYETLSTFSKKQPIDSKSSLILHSIVSLLGDLLGHLILLVEVMKEVRSIKLRKQKKIRFRQALLFRFLNLKKLEWNINWQQMKYGIKTVISASLVFYLQIYFQWPFGLTAIVSAIFVSFPLMGKTIQTIYWRIGGVLLGAVWGLICLAFVNWVEHVWALFFVITLSLLYAGYQINKGMRETAILLQAGIAFVMVLLPDVQIADNLLLGLNRVIGILVGSSIAWMISQLLFPSYAHQLLLWNVGRILKLLATYYKRCISQSTLKNEEASAFAKNEIHATAEMIKTNLQQQPELLAQIPYEKKTSKEEKERYIKLILIINELSNHFFWLQASLRQTEGREFNLIFLAQMNDLHQRLQSLLLNCSKHLKQKKPLIMEDFKQLKEKLEKQLVELEKNKFSITLNALRKIILSCEQLQILLST